MRLRSLPVLLLAGLMLTPAARADEVGDQINKALLAYHKRDIRETITALDAAANMLRQARADALKTLLPLPPPGWTADPAETSAVSGAMLGGGTSATRVYHKNPERVEVQITTDSPMLQGIATLVNSPLAASSGIKTIVVSGRPMAYTPSDNGFMTLVGETVIVKVDGNKDTPEATLRAFLAVMDFAAMEKIGR